MVDHPVSFSESFDSSNSAFRVLGAVAVALAVFGATACGDSPPPASQNQDDDNDEAETLAVSNLAADPAPAAVGQTVEFSWEATGALDCEIDATGDGDADETFDECDGEFNYDYVYDEAGTREVAVSARDDEDEVRETLDLEVFAEGPPVVDADFQDRAFVQNSVAAPGGVDEQFGIESEAVPVDELTVSASSSNQDVVADEDIEVECDGGDCDLTFGVERAERDEADVEVIVEDDEGLSDSASLSVVVEPRTVENPDNTGDDTLRDVLDQAEPGDYVVFELDGEDIELMAPIDVDKLVHLEGPGADELTIDAQGEDRLFELGEDAELELSGVTLTGGEAPEDEGGGAIYNEGTLTLVEVVVEDNRADGESGGAVYNDGTVRLERSTIRDNEGRFGGAIRNYGHLVVDETTFVANDASATGGAIYSGSRPAGEGSLIVRNSTFESNWADNHGAGILNDEDDSGDVEVVVYNSTFTDNAVTNAGAAIQSLGYIEISFTTVVGNRVEDDPDAVSAIHEGGGIRSSGTMDLKATIVTGNEAPDAEDFSGTTDTDDNELVESLGYNIVGDYLDFTRHEDDESADEIDIGELADNGGPTETMLPADDSIGVDLVPESDCMIGEDKDEQLTRDQRGEGRPGSDQHRCDSGAVELQ